jgi:K+-sensing histidine kinase KdpD
MAQTENDRRLDKVIAPNMPREWRRIYITPLFWLPLVLSIGLTVLLNSLIVTVGNQKLTNFAIIEQTLVIGVIALTLYTIVRERYMVKHRQRELQNELTARDSLDIAKDAFIQKTRDSLAATVKELSLLRANIPSSIPIASSMVSGIGRLEHLLKEFAVLSRVTDDSIDPESAFDAELANSASEEADKKIAAKALKVTNIGDDIQSLQTHSLLGQVISTVLDNAAEFSQEGGKVLIDSYEEDNQRTVRITNEGSGFARDPQELFGMFERGDAATDFTHGGIGLSLYLDLLIMRRLGGTITARNIADGAEVILTIPVGRLADILDR